MDEAYKLASRIQKGEEIYEPDHLKSARIATWLSTRWFSKNMDLVKKYCHGPMKEIINGRIPDSLTGDIRIHCVLLSIRCGMDTFLKSPIIFSFMREPKSLDFGTLSILSALHSKKMDILEKTLYLVTGQGYKLRDQFLSFLNVAATFRRGDMVNLLLKCYMNNCEFDHMHVSRYSLAFGNHWYLLPVYSSIDFTLINVKDYRVMIDLFEEGQRRESRDTLLFIMVKTILPTEALRIIFEFLYVKRPMF